MTLYKFSINSKGICREQIEVEEKEKTFQKQIGLSKQVFKKSELDVVTYSYGSPEMISLKGNPEKFVRAVIEHKKNKINQLEKQLATEKNFIIKLKSEYSNVLINRVDEDGCYLATGIICFEHDGDKVSGKPLTYVSDRRVPITNVLFADDFINLINDENFNNNIVIKRIFVNGSETNLGLEGFVFDKSACIVNMEKFEEIVKRHKVEVDVIVKEEK